MKTKVINDKLLIGRFEWCALPQLAVPAIKAKIDTGAKTSAIHAFNIAPFFEAGVACVKYDIHPLQSDDNHIIRCVSEVIDKRYIMSSNGHKEQRYVIATQIKLGGSMWPIELTLSNRDPLRFRLLLGREALNHKVIIDPSLSYNQLSISAKTVQQLYS